MATDPNIPQDNDGPSTGTGGLLTSVDNPPREWRPWACHIPCCGRSFARSRDLSTHLAHCRSPDGNEDAYIGSLVNLIQKNKGALRKEHLSEAIEDSTKLFEDLSKAEVAENGTRIEKLGLPEAEVAKTRSGTEEVQQDMDNAQAAGITDKTGKNLEREKVNQPGPHIMSPSPNS